MAKMALFMAAAMSLGAAIVPTPADQSQPDADSRAIRQVLEDQQAAWNRGDIEQFMRGYWNSFETVFVSGDEVVRGWQPVHDRYRAKYSDRAKMGTLRFSDIEIRLISSDAAVVLGHWELERASDKPHGRFTLIFRRMNDGWKIVHDHTSAASPP